MARLTKQVVDAAKPKERAYFIWCDSLRGFGARIHPTERKAYYVDYRNRDGDRPRMKIADHGKVTTEEARKLALQTLGDAAKGRRPGERARHPPERAHGQRPVRRLHGRRREGSDGKARVAEEAVHDRAGSCAHQPPYRPPARPQDRPRAEAGRWVEVH